MKNSIERIKKEGEKGLQEIEAFQALYLLLGYNVEEITIKTALDLRQEIKEFIAKKMEQLNIN